MSPLHLFVQLATKHVILLICHSAICNFIKMLSFSLFPLHIPRMELVTFDFTQYYLSYSNIDCLSWTSLRS